MIKSLKTDISMPDARSQKMILEFNQLKYMEKGKRDYPSLCQFVLELLKRL